MKYITRIIAVITSSIAMLTGPSCRTAFADGGKLRVMQTEGDYQVTVFTSPNPLRAGPIDLSVLVQEVRTGRAVAEAAVVVRLTRPDDSYPHIIAEATAAAATNKLLQAALVELPVPGSWDVCVQCTISQADADARRLTEVRFTMEASPPLPRWLLVWPWFAWPMAAVLVFALHRTLVARRASRATPRASASIARLSAQCDGRAW
jgi:hypothetical protein